MLEDANVFNQNLSGWCVTKIPTKPDGFDTNSSLTSGNLPVWGTCPWWPSSSSSSVFKSSLCVCTTTYYTVDLKYMERWFSPPVKVVKRNHHHKCVVSTSFLIKVKEETRHAPFSRPCVCAFTIPYVKICNTLCLLVIIKAVTSIPVMNDWKQYCCCEPTFQGGCLNSTSVCIYHVQGVIDIEAALKLFIYYI